MPVRPGYSTNATVPAPISLIWSSPWGADGQAADLEGYSAACPLCYNRT
jgi:hypothetical protein